MGNVTTTNDYSPALTAGYYAHALTAGDDAHATTAGHLAHALTAGDDAHAYPNYGLPVFRATAVKYGFENRIALENPIGCISSRIRKPDQIIQPWWFGEDASKATKGLPLLKPTDIIRKARYAKRAK